jgi:hypothetical protein
MHRAMLRPVACTRSECTRTQWHNHLTMHCQSASCVLELGLQLKHGRGQALSARTGVAQPPRAEISPFDLLVGDAAVCMSAGRPSFDSSPMTQTTCSPAAVPTTPGQFNWQLFSVTIEIDLAGHAWCSVCRFSSDTVQWTTLHRSLVQ